MCQKVKASYLTVGHTHNDDDGDIGVSGNHMCSKDIQTLSLCGELIEESFEKFHSSGTFIVPIIGITDYSAVLPDTAAGNPFKINGKLLLVVNTNIDFSALIISFAGIARAQVIRFSMVDGKCVVHYQEDPAQDGWFPRPAPLIRSEIWDTLFAHPDDPRRHGHPLTCEAFGIKDRGKRQHWQVLQRSHFIMHLVLINMRRVLLVLPTHASTILNMPMETRKNLCCLVLRCHFR